MSRGTTAVAAAFSQSPSRSNKNNCLAEKSDYMGVIKSPCKHIFIFLWFDTKQNSQLIALDLSLVLQNPTLTVCQRLDIAEETVLKALLQQKLHLQNIKNYLLLIIRNLWFCSLYFFSFLPLTSWTLLSLSIDSAKH